MATPNWSWQERARCRGEDLVLFFGPEGERQPERDVREWKAMLLCRSCPVRTACLNYALDLPEKYGVWGGLSEEERATQRRRRMRYATTHPEPVPASTVDEKECHSCLEKLPAADFPRDRRSKDGLNSQCKDCANEAGRRRRQGAKQAVAS
ncbi:WhiB family transcriptional regulator [Nonomuraea sp. NPDC004702]